MKQRLMFVLTVDERIAHLHTSDVTLATRLGELEAIAQRDADEEDLDRAKLIESVLETDRPVQGVLHPSVDSHDIWDVVLRPADGSRLFATVLVTPSRLEKMLDEAPVVVEGLMLQVLEGEHPTPAVVHAAMEGWARRNFNRNAPFVITPWIDPAESVTVDPPLENGPLQQGALDIPATQQTALPVEPAWEEAA